MKRKMYPTVDRGKSRQHSYSTAVEEPPAPTAEIQQLFIGSNEIRRIRISCFVEMIQRRPTVALEKSCTPP